MTSAVTLQDAAAFNALALALTQDATSVVNSAFGLAGQFGRYATGPTRPGISSELDAVTQANAARASVAAAARGLVGALNTNGDAPGAVQAVLDAVLAAVFAPADQLRACTVLAGSTGGSQLAILCRRLSVVALASAASAYAPTSYDDAQAVLGALTDALDAEITEAGDAEDSASFDALRVLRSASVGDLTARGASLAPLVTISLGANLPAFLVASLVYGDATRADEIVARVPDCPNPLFLPAQLVLLAR